MHDIEDKVAALVRDITKLTDADKRKAIIQFVESVLQIERSTFLMERHDLAYIRDRAAAEWHSIIPGQRMGGIPLSAEEIQTLMWSRAVIMCLRKYKLLEHVIDFQFDINSKE